MTSERTIRLLSWLNAAYNFRLYSAIAVIYFAQVTGSYALALAVFSAAHLSGALLEIPTGLLSDRFGRVATLRLGAAANALAVGLYAIAGSAGGFGLLAAGGVLEGAGRALFSGNNDACSTRRWRPTVGGRATPRPWGASTPHWRSRASWPSWPARWSHRGPLRS